MHDACKSPCNGTQGAYLTYTHRKSEHEPSLSTQRNLPNHPKSEVPSLKFKLHCLNLRLRVRLMRTCPANADVLLPGDS